MRYVLATLLALAASTPTFAADWYSHRTDRDRLFLYEGNTFLGEYRISAGTFRPYDQNTHQLGQPCPPPVALPRGFVTNYGLQRDRIGRRERFFRNGQEISQAEAFRELARGGQVPADGHQLMVTVIGPQEALDRVRRDMQSNQTLAQFRGQVRDNYYLPDHWAVQCGFVASGNPTIYIQTPNGEVLHRQDDYEDGPAGLAQAILEARRRYDPNYKPASDRDLRKFKILNVLFNLPTEALLIVGGLVILLLTPTARK